MADKVFRRGISRCACMLLAVCMLTGFAGTVSACGGTDSYSSNVLYTNWDWLSDQFYQKTITNPTTCVSGVIVVLPGNPKSTKMDYLGYSISKYWDKFTDEQKDKVLTDPGLTLLIPGTAKDSFLNTMSKVSGSTPLPSQNFMITDRPEVSAIEPSWTSSGYSPGSSYVSSDDVVREVL